MHALNTAVLQVTYHLINLFFNQYIYRHAEKACFKQKKCEFRTDLIKTFKGSPQGANKETYTVLNYTITEV